MKIDKTFYITTPIYYLNSKPHIGTLYSTILADVIARWNRLCGKKVLFVTGSDEHGQKIFDSACAAHKPPQLFVDEMVQFFKKTWAMYDISYDIFFRTTSEEHKRGVQALLAKLYEQGDIYKSFYEGWYCTPCESFVVDYVVSSGGSHLCPACEREVQRVEEESYFFRLSAYQERLLEFFENNPTFIFPRERRNEVITFVRSGLKDLSISRKSVKWGIPFPGDEAHTVYVWGDALTNYISALGFGSDEKKFLSWWPAQCHVIGKDIIRFHAVYWLAFLMSAELPLPEHLLVHGFILNKDQKISKSRGNTIDPEELASWYGEEQVRYYLARHMAVTHDGHLSFDDMEAHITADLAHTLGNLVQRTCALAVQNKYTTIDVVKDWQPQSAYLKELCEEAFRSYHDAMDHYQLHVALASLWKFIADVNKYFHEMEPWKVVKNDRELFQEIIWATSHSLYAIALMAMPVMPKKMHELLDALGAPFKENYNYAEELRVNNWDHVFVLKPLQSPLFVPVDRHAQGGNHERTTLQKNNNEKGHMIGIEDFTKVHLIVGQIVSCEHVDDSDKLYKLTVDMGAFGKRIIVSGVAHHFTPEDLIGKQGIYVANLEPRNIMGIESQGMMLFAKDHRGALVLATVGASVDNGTRLA